MQLGRSSMGHARKGVLIELFLKTTLGRGQGRADDPLVKCYKHEDPSLYYPTFKKKKIVRTAAYACSLSTGRGHRGSSLASQCS